MLTLRAAANLLAAADSLAALRPVARELGFPGPGVPVNADAQHDLAIHGLVTEAELTRGPGSMRLLSASLNPDQPAISAGNSGNSGNSGNAGRELTRRVCAALAREAPTRRWCALTLDPARSELFLATVTPYAGGPRIAALRVDRNRVVDSDADTLRALAAVTEPHDGLRHARFTDVLKRDALSARFYHALDAAVRRLATTAKGVAPESERQELALLCASRCLFLAFLEAKGWLNDDRNFLLGHVSARLEAGGGLHERLLKPLFFGTLNTPLRNRSAASLAFGDVPFLNGGLFSPTRVEQRRHTMRFDDDAIVALVGDVLDRYRFTAHEDSTAWSEAAVDPEMLGRAFECLMAADERRRSGSYYTPPALVQQIVQDGLAVALPEIPDALLAGATLPTVAATALSATRRTDLLDRILALRVLDPACGSGAFLVHTLERLADIASALGDPRALHVIRRGVLTTSIFGVDRNPMAVWLCELRLWLSVVIECPGTDAASIPPLPNLDHHVRIGDTLAGGGFDMPVRGASRLTLLRQRYTRATGRRKQSLANLLDGEERIRAIAEVDRQRASVANERCEMIARLRARDLFGERARRSAPDHRELISLKTRQRELGAQGRKLAQGAALPFRFATHFADSAARGGFDLIVGNPPWVRPHAVPAPERERLRTEFRTLRYPTWQAGAKRAGAGAGFAAQADLAAAFVERSAGLLASDGTMALLVPAKLWRSLAGGGVRRLLTDDTTLHTLRDWSDAPAQFDAATYPSLVVAQRRTTTTTAQATGQRPVRISVARGHAVHEFETPAARVALCSDATAPWVLLPPPVRAAFDRFQLSGPALGESSLGRPTLGVKCGCNAAFIVRVTDGDEEFATVSANGRTGTVERRMLRPLLRGEDLARETPLAAPVDGAAEGGSHIIWTHGPDGRPLAQLPPRAARWLAAWRTRLELRRDSRTRAPWWTLFRTDSAASDAPRVAWADMARRLRTTVLQTGDPSVPINSCYVMRLASDVDALALHALLSSRLATAWLDAIAEPARGGFRRYLGWTVASLPIPVDWTHARTALAAAGRHMTCGGVLPQEEHDDVTLAAYDLSRDDMAPLLAWWSA